MKEHGTVIVRENIRSKYRDKHYRTLVLTEQYCPICDGFFQADTSIGESRYFPMDDENRTKVYCPYCGNHYWVLN